MEHWGGFYFYKIIYQDREDRESKFVILHYENEKQLLVNFNNNFTDESSGHNSVGLPFFMFSFRSNHKHTDIIIGVLPCI